MNLIRAVESFEYFHECTGISFRYWKYWGRKMIREWNLDLNKLKGGWNECQNT